MLDWFRRLVGIETKYQRERREFHEWLDRCRVAIDADDFAALKELLPAEVNDHWAMLADTASEEGKFNVLGGLLDVGLPVDSRYYGGPTLLARAASRDDIDSVRFLLDRGATMAGVPLVGAIKRGSAELILLLIAEGAGVNHGLPGFPTPLAAAREYERPDLEKILVQHGATEMVGKGARPVQMSPQHIIPPKP